MHEIEFRAPLPEELAPLFPSYRILSLIATGGMGAVYHAMQTSLEREVAIKILPLESGNNPEFTKSFASEAKTMARLNHPNLITVYDFGEINGMLFLVMEYVPGQSLHDACCGSAVEPAEVIRLMTGISMGLAHAHEHAILHRDIKPANILLDTHLRPKIGDFGLARPMDAQISEGESIFGTPGYTAPEVLMPPHTMDQRADIFSLGILLHELLTGHLPENDPRPPSAISNCDPRFDAVVRKATHPDPLQRYQSATEISDALGNIASKAGPKMVHAASPARPNPQAAPGLPNQSLKKEGTGLMLSVFVFAGLLAVYFLRHQIFGTDGPDQKPVPVIVHMPEPATPAPELPIPEPGQVTAVPETAQPEPGTVESQPEPVIPEPGPIASQSEPVISEPEPAASGGETHTADVESVPGPQPKFDVEGFLARARSVMVGRCAPHIMKHNQELDRNLTDFRRDGWSLIEANLGAVYHQAGKGQLDAYIDECKRNGNRLAEQLKPPLKFKKWLVELHEQHQKREAKLDEVLGNAFAEHNKTYLYGLDLKLKALQQEDDPAAVDMIKAEIDKATADPDYFSGLMLKANEG